jgi:hypothetical protein
MRHGSWLIRLAPRVAILVTAAAELVYGSLVYGAFCLIALVLTLIPALRARNVDAGIPIELELGVLWLMIADMTLGNSFGMYELNWFDKVLHLSSSALIGMVGFLAIYVLHLTHRTRFHPWLDGVAILLVTLGLGAVWEIGEYGVDQLLGRATQGAPNMNAIDDTMVDLMLDGAGGLIGAIVGPWYIRRSRESRRRVAAFGRMIEHGGDSR